MQAVIFCLVAFGYIDNDFDRSERIFIRDLIGKCVNDPAASIEDERVRQDVAARWNNHYLEVMVEMDRNIRGHFSESVGEGESTNDFVLAKLKLGCFELLRGFEPHDRAALLGRHRPADAFRWRGPPK